MHSAEETGLVSCQFVRTCGWSQRSLSSEGPCSEWGVEVVVGINALVEMGKLGRSLGDFFCIPALPFGGPISWEGDGGREIGNGWPLLCTKVYVT